MNERREVLLAPVEVNPFTASLSWYDCAEKIIILFTTRRMSKEVGKRQLKAFEESLREHPYFAKTLGTDHGDGMKKLYQASVLLKNNGLFALAKFFTTASKQQFSENAIVAGPFVPQDKGPELNRLLNLIGGDTETPSSTQLQRSIAQELLHNPVVSELPAFKSLGRQVHLGNERNIAAAIGDVVDTADIGNIIHQFIVMRMLVSPISVDATNPLSAQDTKLLLATEGIVDYLFYPTLASLTTQESEIALPVIRDRNWNAFFESLHPAVLLQICATILGQLGYSVITRALAQNDYPFMRAVGAVGAYFATDPDRPRYFFQQDVDMVGIFHKEEKQIRQSLEKRFGSRFVETIYALLNENFTVEQIHNQEIIDRITEISGAPFVDFLDTNTQAFTDIQTNLQEHSSEFSIRVPVARHITIEFSPGTLLPNSMGAHAIELYRVRDGAPINFRLQCVVPNTNKIPIDVTGFIVESGEKITIETSVDFSASHPGLQQAIEVLVMSAYADFSASRIPTRGATTAGASNTPPHEQYSYAKTQTTKIPRTKSTSGEEHREAEREVLVSPHLVDEYIRDRVGAGEYRAACALYDEARATNDDIQIQQAAVWVQEAQARMYKHSAEKHASIAILPPHMQERFDPVIDPFTGERMYLKTWAKEHWNPTLTPEEEQSVAALHKRVYKINGSSAMAALNVGIRRMLGGS